MCKSLLTGAQVIEHDGMFKVLYKGYTIFRSLGKNESIMLSLSKEQCNQLLEETSVTYKKQA